MNKDIIDRITSFIRSAFNDETLEFKPELSADGIPGWTSLSFMKLLESLEQEFGFRFKVMELISVRTLGDLAAVVEKHIG